MNKWISGTDKIERLLRERGFLVERRNRSLKVVRTGFGRFSRRMHDDILDIIDRYGAKVSFAGSFYIHKREDR